MPVDQNAALFAEARHLHVCLFGQSWDDDVAERYAAANAKLFPQRAQSELMRKIVARKLDAEAIEIVLRRRGTGRELTVKFQILCYLVEVRSAYLADFVNLQNGRARAATALVFSIFRTAWKIAAGEYLIRRYGLL